MHQAVQSGVRSEGDGAGAEAPARRYLAVHQHLQRWRTGPDAVRGGVLPIRATLRDDERPDSHFDADSRGSRGGRERNQRQDEYLSGNELPRVNDD